MKPTKDEPVFYNVLMKSLNNTYQQINLWKMA